MRIGGNNNKSLYRCKFMYECVSVANTNNFANLYADTGKQHSKKQYIHLYIDMCMCVGTFIFCCFFSWQFGFSSFGCRKTTAKWSVFVGKQAFVYLCDHVRQVKMLCYQSVDSTHFVDFLIFTANP